MSAQTSRIENLNTGNQLCSVSEILSFFFATMPCRCSSILLSRTYRSLTNRIYKLVHGPLKRENINTSKLDRLTSLNIGSIVRRALGVKIEESAHIECVRSEYRPYLSSCPTLENAHSRTRRCVRLHKSEFPSRLCNRIKRVPKKKIFHFYCRFGMKTETKKYRTHEETKDMRETDTGNWYDGIVNQEFLLRL